MFYSLSQDPKGSHEHEFHKPFHADLSTAGLCKCAQLFITIRHESVKSYKHP